MTAKILDGRKLSQQMQIEIKKEVAAFNAAWNATPTDCANCHIASQVEIDFGGKTDPPSWIDMSTSTGWPT